MTTTRLVLFEIFLLLVVYSCFCRATHTSKANTRRPIRWTFSALGAVAVFSALGPLVADYQPDGVATALAGVLCLSQLVTNHYWRNGVPAPFKETS